MFPPRFEFCSLLKFLRGEGQPKSSERGKAKAIYAIDIIDAYRTMAARPVFDPLTFPRTPDGPGGGSPGPLGGSCRKGGRYFFLLTSMTSPKRSHFLAEGLYFASCSAWIG
jgi:hypothetical protein